MKNKGENMFDVIVVGAGTAGCVAARQLAEKQGKKVLILEILTPLTLQTIKTGSMMLWRILFVRDLIWNLFIEF